jgi:S-DNA-T family DNA segregation ATPase FtsK/SpoIIIE
VVIRTPSPVLPSSGRTLRVLQVLAPIAGAGSGLVFAIAYRQTLALLIVMGAAIGVGVLVAVVTAIAQALAGRRQRLDSRRRYLDYLAAEERALRALIATQDEREALLFPDAEGLLELAQRRERVFERRPRDPDWLEVRAGSGALPPAVRVVLQEVDPLGPEPEPALLAAAEALVERHRTRERAPVVVRLREAGTLVLRGPPGTVRGVARSLVTQAAVFHPPAELGIAVLTEDGRTALDWDWIKWLPHTRLASTAADGEPALEPAVAASAAEAGVLLRDLLGSRAGGGRHLLVVVDGWTPAGSLARLAALRTLMRNGPRMGATVLCSVASPADEPGELLCRLAIDPDGGAVTEMLGEVVSRSPRFTAEPLGEPAALAIARRLTPLRIVREEAEAPRVPGAAASSLLDALGLGPLPRIDVGPGWARAQESLLRAPVGVGVDGERVELDLKELSQGGMGPHGMLIGATGSGKSELLRTLVAGLAATHPPELLAFVLVDFKGGAAFQPMARLPHVAGMVTNLEDDPTMVERFRLAVEGEMVRRQSLFRSAGSVPDIRAYHLRRSTDPELEPLPHLWLVVDELAELLTAHPDFDLFFEGVARLGRALGIHLLLATQGLSSGLARLDRHLSYRLCLRTNSLQESVLVLGSPIAAQLPLSPGVGYLKVGQGEPQRFRAYLIGGPPRDASPGRRTHPDAAVRNFSVTRPAESGGTEPGGDEPTARSTSSAEGTTELSLLVERIASRGAAPAHPVWVTPLPRTVSLDRVLTARGHSLQVGLGLADYPLQQQRRPWAIDFHGPIGHLAIVGAPRTGRSTALRTIAASFLLTHDPRSVQLYVLDMGGSLQALVDAPHVGAVAGKGDPEVVRRIMRLLTRLVDQRDRELRRLGLGGIDELRRRWRERGSDDGFGDVFLLVDNWGAATRAFDWIEEEVTALAGVGLSYGVHLVLSADRWGDIRPALRDRIPGRLQLRPIDPGDSAYDLRATRALSSTPGRALAAGPCQVQLALPRIDGGDPAVDVDTAFRDLVAHRALPGAAAPRVPLLPRTVPLGSLDWADWRRRREIPLDIGDADLRPVPLDLLARDAQHLYVCGDPRCGKTSFLRALMLAMTRVLSPGEVQFHLVDIRRSLLDAVPDGYVGGHAMTASAVEAVVQGLSKELSRRQPPPGASRKDLAERRHIEGPELVLVVDDDDLVDASALSPLVPAVPVAWDLKFHVVLARRPAPPGYDSLGSALAGQGAVGVEMSEAERCLFVPRPVHLPPGRAHLVVRGQPTLLQLIHAGEG